jgi:hypothetical protein
MTIAIAGENLNAQRAQKLAVDLMEVIKAHYLEGRMERARVLEVLNALALCTAVTVHGTDDTQFATDIFAAAFSMNLDLYRENFPHSNPEQS